MNTNHGIIFIVSLLVIFGVRGHIRIVECAVNYNGQEIETHWYELFLYVLPSELSPLTIDYDLNYFNIEES